MQQTDNAQFAQSIAAELFENYGMILQLTKLSGHPIQALDPALVETPERACNMVLNQIQRLELAFRLKKGASSVAVGFDNHVVMLSRRQVEEIEGHISDARQKIRSSSAFEEKHKLRLLNRLEKLQAEINKKISDLDVMLAGVTEVTVVAGQSAKNLKPVVDLFKKIFLVAEGETNEPLGLPAPPKQIEDKSGEPES